MNPIAMTVILVATLSALTYSINRRLQLMRVAQEPADRLDRVPERVWATIKYAFGQYKMPYYRLAGFAHALIFVGFCILLLRSLMLWGRAFSPDFNLWFLGPEPVLGLPLGHLYDLAKDIAAVLVIAGALAFVYLRVVVKEKRMTLHWEGLLILGIIVTMMVTDLLYDGALLALGGKLATGLCDKASGDLGATCESAKTVVAPLGPHAGALAFHWYAPAGSVVGMIFKGMSPGALVVIAHLGFWIHSTLVLVFANILPYTKHFHIFTVMPNVFTASLEPRGRLLPIAKNSEALMEKVGAAADLEDPNEMAIGVARVEHLTWKSVLDFYTCTECGRCSDNCPAFNTGKQLSPKQFTLDLRNFMWTNANEMIDGVRPEKKEEHEGHGDHGHDDAHGHAHEGGDDHGHHEPVFPDNPVPNPPPQYKPKDLVPDVIQPDVLWACTTCMACEEFCPVLISYVDKIVDMRRNLVLVRGEFPQSLAKPFEAMETNGNPWNLSRMDRAAWADGLGIKTMAEKPDADVLFWVGCAGSYDDRAKKVARATARLLQAAGVDFAILGEEETCSGDPARRAGNEYLFATLAEANVATINGYKDKGGAKTVLTTCPHCFNTLGIEYKDFGGDFKVVHHTEYLLGLVRSGKLTPKNKLPGRVVFHDSCYLGRYNGVYDQPREVLASIPGVQLVEPDRNRNLGLCCGAGGAQMFMEEQNKDRMNVRRTLQLLKTAPDTIATACPFCMTMLTDGLKDQEKEDTVKQLDVAELLEKSCLDAAEGAGPSVELQAEQPVPVQA